MVLYMLLVVGGMICSVLLIGQFFGAFGVRRHLTWTLPFGLGVAVFLLQIPVVLLAQASPPGTGKLLESCAEFFQWIPCSFFLLAEAILCGTLLSQWVNGNRHTPLRRIEMPYPPKKVSNEK